MVPTAVSNRINKDTELLEQGHRDAVRAGAVHCSLDPVSVEVHRPEPVLEIKVMG